jgi:exopolyphosphatase/guanosine-5'-triphosphate,3'-diphosphate pyrophosphatase
MYESDNIFAAADIGSNTFHLIIVKISDEGKFQIVARLREVFRLLESSKTISFEKIEKSAEILKKFKSLADSWSAPLKVAATSSLREAENSDEFTDYIFVRTGISIETISGEREAELIYRGILKALPVHDKRVLCIDIGGGSTEFIIGESGKTLFKQSIEIGAVKLKNVFFRDGDFSFEKIEADVTEITDVIKKIKTYTPQIFIGTGGTIISTGFLLAGRQKQKEYQSTYLNNFIISQKGIENLFLKLLKGQLDISGLESDRKDIYFAGLVLLNILFKNLEIPEMMISGFSIREGIVTEMMKSLNK